MRNRLKAIFLSLLMIFAVCSFSACKDKKEDKAEKKSPTVNVKVENREFYVGEKLSDIEITLTEGDTEGVVEWKNPDTELVLGENTCEWKFTPESTSKYKTKSGEATLVAVTPKADPVVNVVVTSENIYAETKLSTVGLALSTGDTAGTVEWQEPDTILSLGKKEYSWKFVPTDAENFKQVTGKVEIDAKAQVLTSISVQTAQTKTSYKAFETFDATGLVLNANYNAGKVEKIEAGWTVVYQTANNLRAGDTFVTLSFEGKSCKVNLTVSKIELDEPEVEGTYVYSGISHTARLTQNENSSKYTVSNNVYTIAGTHSVTVTINDFANYKWKTSTVQSITIPFVIEKADLVIQKNNYSGVYDGLSHQATVNAFGSTVYYSLSELDKSNYTTGSTTPIEFVNAVNAKVYFYVAGDNNHKDMISYVTVDIQKANANVRTDYCYSVVSSKTASVPLNYVFVRDIYDELISTAGKLELVYYSSYVDETNNTKTSAEDGALTEGGAPKNAGRYIVKSIFTGSENYARSEGISILLIDNDDCELLAHGDENVFAWRSASIDQQTVDAYFEINKQDTGLLCELVVTAKINGEIVDGKVVKQDGIYKFISDDGVFVIDISSIGSSKQIKLLNQSSEVFKTLTKWEIPNFVGTFERDTVTSDDVTPNSQLVITHEYGVITFVLKGYYVSGTVKLVEKSGVVTYSSGSLSFLTVGASSELIASASQIDNSTEVLSITLGSPLTPPALKGEYVKV